MTPDYKKEVQERAGRIQNILSLPCDEYDPEICPDCEKVAAILSLIDEVEAKGFESGYMEACLENEVANTDKASKIRAEARSQALREAKEAAEKLKAQIFKDAPFPLFDSESDSLLAEFGSRVLPVIKSLQAHD